MGDYGYRISQTGYDVKTCTDAQCVITSKYNSFKIPSTLQGSSTLSVAAQGSATLQVNHNLGYIPAWEAWYENEQSVWHSVFQFEQLGNTTDLYVDILGTNFQYATTSSIFIGLNNRSQSSTRVATIYYIIFLEVGA